MNDLLNINYDGNVPTVSARDLHEKLKIKKRFSEWFKTNSKGFVENQDYFGVYLEVQGNQYGGTQEIREYNMTVDMAKHFCLMSRTDEGQKCRQYLIDVEKAWNTPEAVMARALQLANRTIENLQNKIKEQQPLVDFANQVSDTTSLIDMNAMAKLVKDEHIPIGRNRLFELLRTKEILRDNNEPYQRYIESGYFKTKETTYDTPYCTKTYIKTLVTGKGQIWITEMLRKEFCKKD